MTLVIDLIVQKENTIKGEEEKQESCWEKSSNPHSYGSVYFHFTPSFFLSGHYAEIIVVLARPALTPWLSAGCPAAEGGGKNVVWMTGV